MTKKIHDGRRPKQIKMEDDQKNRNGRRPKNSKWKTTKRVWSAKFQNATTTKFQKNLIQYKIVQIGCGSALGNLVLQLKYQISFGL